MKFMKLGTRPDTFFTSDSVRSVSSEITTDITIQVDDTKFLLHKFPLLSKCSHLKSLLLEPTVPEVVLPGFPGGPAAFELCAKFCYNITITLSAVNIVTARCAAEYLQMSDDIEKGNLAGKLDSFLNSCILRRWKDSLVALQSTRKLPVWSEEIGLTGRCIDAIATGILANPSRPSSSGWWAKDISELRIDHFWRIMLAVKSSGKISGEAVGEAMIVYACRWLPSCLSDEFGEVTVKQKLLLEKIVSLLPVEKGSVPCRFLLQLLKAANKLSATASMKSDLARRAGVQLEEAAVADLLIPVSSETSKIMYDVDMVMMMLEEFLLQGRSPPESPQWRKLDAIERRRRSRSAEGIEFECGRRSFSVSHGSMLKVAKTIDGYLQEIARDLNLPMEKLMALAEAVPDFARIDHDYLYKAIDIYLKAHPDLTKSDRKRLCRVLDCKKLSMEACKHAAQNEMLPLRVVVQVLFFEQARAAMSGSQSKELPDNIKELLAGTVLPHDSDDWSVSTMKFEKPNLATLRMKLNEDHDNDGDVDGEYCILKRNGINGLMRSSSARFRALCAIPDKPRRMINKLWSLNRSIRERR